MLMLPFCVLVCYSTLHQSTNHQVSSVPVMIKLCLANLILLNIGTEISNICLNRMTPLNLTGNLYSIQIDHKCQLSQENLVEGFFCFLFNDC